MHIFLSAFVFRELKESTQLLYCGMAERKFNRGEKDKYSLSEKDELGKLCVNTRKNMTKKLTKIRAQLISMKDGENIQQNYQEKDILIVQFEGITKT